MPPGVKVLHIGYKKRYERQLAKKKWLEIHVHTTLKKRYHKLSAGFFQTNITTSIRILVCFVSVYCFAIDDPLTYLETPSDVQLNFLSKQNHN